MFNFENSLVEESNCCTVAYPDNETAPHVKSQLMATCAIGGIPKIVKISNTCEIPSSNTLVSPISLHMGGPDIELPIARDPNRFFWLVCR